MAFEKPGLLVIFLLMSAYVCYAVHVWSSALESSGESRVISLDISKAFDRVWHKGLLAKLPMFGLHHTLINWNW